jgi:hypothetical protein
MPELGHHEDGGKYDSADQTRCGRLNQTVSRVQRIHSAAGEDGSTSWTQQQPATNPSARRHRFLNAKEDDGRGEN